MAEMGHQPINLLREIISWVLIGYLQEQEFRQTVHKDSHLIQDFTSIRKKHQNRQLLALMVPVDKNHLQIEITEFPTSVDPIRCKEKHQESKLLLVRQISWREIGKD